MLTIFIIPEKSAGAWEPRSHTLEPILWFWAILEPILWFRAVLEKNFCFVALGFQAPQATFLRFDIYSD